MKDNLEIIKDIVSKEKRAVEVLLEMKKKYYQETDGYIMIKYKKGIIKDVGVHRNS